MKMKTKVKILGAVVLAMFTVFLAVATSVAVVFETLDREDN